MQDLINLCLLLESKTGVKPSNGPQIPLSKRLYKATNPQINSTSATRFKQFPEKNSRAQTTSSAGELSAFGQEGNISASDVAVVIFITLSKGYYHSEFSSLFLRRLLNFPRHGA
jgi:hypothetical protein